MLFQQICLGPVDKHQECPKVSFLSGDQRRALRTSPQRQPSTSCSQLQRAKHAIQNTPSQTLEQWGLSLNFRAEEGGGGGHQYLKIPQ